MIKLEIHKDKKGIDIIDSKKSYTIIMAINKKETKKLYERLSKIYKRMG